MPQMSISCETPATSSYALLSSKSLAKQSHAKAKKHITVMSQISLLEDRDLQDGPTIDFAMN